MSAGPTLNSRLRVLVAKTYRAEKLYSSIRNNKGQQLSSSSALSEMANDIRAREWQRSHYELRTALNEILSLGNSSAVTEHIIELRRRFAEKCEENLAAIEKGKELLIETAKRQEFSQIFRNSAELIRCKARAQADKLIVEELTSVLDSSVKNAAPKSPRPEMFRSLVCDIEVAGGASEDRDAHQAGLKEEPRVALACSNVIPLSRSAAGGGGRRPRR